jgi:hypothetical protein
MNHLKICIDIYITMNTNKFPLPDLNTFTVYTKSGCPFCDKTKQLLSSLNKYTLIINCDDYCTDDD